MIFARRSACELVPYLRATERSLILLATAIPCVRRQRPCFSPEFMLTRGDRVDL